MPRFLPFDQGYNDGAGNPPNPNGLATDFLCKRILTPAGLADILENYAQMVVPKDPRTKKEERTQLFPRYHQLDVVRKLLADVRARGGPALSHPALGGQRQIELSIGCRSSPISAAHA